jgi:hypothetical protein
MTTTARARCHAAIVDDQPGTTFHLGATTEALASLDRRRRRRLLVKAVVRILATTALLLVVYFQIPIGGSATTWGWVTLLISLLAFALAAAFQIRRIMDAPLPQLRAIETVATAIPVFVILFALVYVTMSETQPASFSEPLTRAAGLYFAVTVFTTVGFGDIVARSDGARLVVAVQMVLDLIILGGLVRVIIGASRIGLERRRAEADQLGRTSDDVP